RMASNSFVAKGWSVTATSALLAVAAGTKHQWIALVALLPVLVFWWLDANYLALERQFRSLFAAVSSPTTGAQPIAVYSMDLKAYKKSKSVAKAFTSWSTGVIHFATVATVVVVFFFTRQASSAANEATRLHVDGPVDVRVVPATALAAPAPPDTLPQK